MTITHEELGFPAPAGSFENLRGVIKRQLGRVELDGTGVSLPRELQPNSTFVLGAKKYDRHGRPIRESRVLGPFPKSDEIAEFFEKMSGSPAISETI